MTGIAVEGFREDPKKDKGLHPGTGHLDTTDQDHNWHRTSQWCQQSEQM